MKLYISENIDKAIQNFTLVPIVYGEVDLSNVPDNAATMIVAVDAIDSIKSKDIENFINNICRKMRLESTLHIGGLDAYAVSRSLLNGTISLDEYNELVLGKTGMYSSRFIIDLLKKNRIQIRSAVYKGHTYEIAATRSNNQN
jgi:predicted CopG family antitoxin